MKKKNKMKLFLVMLMGVFTTVVASGCSCTNSMCSSSDEANIKRSIEKKNIEEWRNTAAVSNTMKVESDEYIAYAKNKVDEIYLNDSLYTTAACVQASTCSSEDIANIKANIKAKYNNEWLNALEEIPQGEEGYIKTRTDAFQNFVNQKLNEEYANHPRACLVTRDDVDPSTGAALEKKTWGDAWKTGLLEGLIVYPLAWLMSVLVDAFGGGGISQFFAILLTVFIIRVLMLTLNFKGQLTTFKMQGLQGEMSKLQAKLKEPNITEQEKQAVAMKMMDLYKKNDINPFSSTITQFISFPIFIAVWAAMNQTLAIRKGNIWGMELGEPINTQIFSGSITAIILFALMIVGQITTMKISAWLKEYKAKKNNPNYRKPEKSDTEKQMNWVMTFMIAMVVFSGFVLPAALVLYWFLGSLFSIAQTCVFSSTYVSDKLKSLANRKKKAKVIR